MTQGDQAALASRYCNKPSTALALAAIAQASATLRKRCCGVIASALHHSNKAATQAHDTSSGSTDALGPLVNGLSHGSAISDTVAQVAAWAVGGEAGGSGWGSDVGGDRFTAADYLGAPRRAACLRACHTRAKPKG